MGTVDPDCGVLSFWLSGPHEEHKYIMIATLREEALCWLIWRQIHLSYSDRSPVKARMYVAQLARAASITNQASTGKPSHFLPILTTGHLSGSGRLHESIPTPLVGATTRCLAD